jgi:hypothetical protein
MAMRKMRLEINVEDAKRGLTNRMKLSEDNIYAVSR